MKSHSKETHQSSEKQVIIDVFSFILHNTKLRVYVFVWVQSIEKNTAC